MKKLLTNFEPIFDPISKTLDFTQLSGFNINKLYAVINVTRNVPIFIPGAPNLGVSSVNNSVLTLQYDTSTHSTSDIINVFYEDSSDLPDKMLAQTMNDALQRILVELKITNLLLHELGANKLFSIGQSELDQLRNDLLDQNIIDKGP